jgi:hypothetical protein
MDPHLLHSSIDLSRYLEESLASAFGAGGWRVRRPARANASDTCDFIAHRDDRAYAVELKVARDARAPMLQALLADASLRARRAAHDLHAHPLPVVGSAILSPRTANTLHEYAARFLDGMPYGLIDAEGQLDLRAPDLASIRAVHRAPNELFEQLRTPPTFDPFSDLNQWLLKVLIADRLPPELLHAPREFARNANHLSQVAGVSVPVASRFVSFMKREGWLATQPSRGRLRPVRLDALLPRWQSSIAQHAPSREVRAKWILPSSDARARLDRALSEFHAKNAESESRVCLALFAAAERLGFAHARGVAQHVYYEGSAARLLEALKAMPAKENEGADLVLRRPRFRESVFRGAVVRDGVPVSDILQTWLDVASHPARGAEQADHLWRHAIAPNLLKGSDS